MEFKNSDEYSSILRFYGYFHQRRLDDSLHAIHSIKPGSNSFKYGTTVSLSSSGSLTLRHELTPLGHTFDSPEDLEKFLNIAQVLAS